MYTIVLKCWYQELINTKSNGIQEDFINKEFETIEEAGKYLGENIEKISNDYPLVSLKIVPNYKK